MALALEVGTGGGNGEYGGSGIPTVEVLSVNDGSNGDGGGDPTIKRIVNTSSGPIVIKTSDPNLDVDDLEKYAVRLSIAGGGGVGARAKSYYWKRWISFSGSCGCWWFWISVWLHKLLILDDDDIGKGATAKAFIGEVIEV